MNKIFFRNVQSYKMFSSQYLIIDFYHQLFVPEMIMMYNNFFCLNIVCTLIKRNFDHITMKNCKVVNINVIQNEYYIKKKRSQL